MKEIDKILLSNIVGGNGSSGLAAAGSGLTNAPGSDNAKSVVSGSAGFGSGGRGR